MFLNNTKVVMHYNIATEMPLAAQHLLAGQYLSSIAKDPGESRPSPQTPDALLSTAYKKNRG